MSGTVAAARIDAHQHFWRLSRGDYGWLTPALAPIHRDFGPGDLRPLLAPHNITATILVQAAPTEAETEFLLQLARGDELVAGVVGWTDLEDADAPRRIAELAADPLLVGLRPMVHDIPDDDWLLRPALAPALAAMARHGLVFDALLRPRHFPHLLPLLDRHPGLSVVLDHGGKPAIAEGASGWAEALAELARHPNLCCKLSGLATEAPADWDIETLRPYAAEILRCFGPERVMWGSDWPVVNLAGGYAKWRAAAEALVPEAARGAVFGGTAARIYLSGRGRPPC
ncbi:amidohydrolase family protein [Teichococcus oryzae]|uniref:Amidohydrolase family protein n=1 Tax=Teichococcus oryzae TaxID=1608942 RepID=A0A5B2TI63_9PROT|nr:amidohydrolase family protein [Pseudoroseomonas oryzae]KAA2213470.1 amidohydrolase family protein [Pseudoroseomonas oryzae]